MAERDDLDGQLLYHLGTGGTAWRTVGQHPYPVPTTRRLSRCYAGKRKPRGNLPGPTLAVGGKPAQLCLRAQLPPLIRRNFLQRSPNFQPEIADFFSLRPTVGQRGHPGSAV